MRIFKRSKYNNLEKSIFDQYVQVFEHLSSSTGLSDFNERSIVGDMLDEAIVEAKKDGSYFFPDKIGDILLSDIEIEDPAFKKVIEFMRKNLPRKRDEGVRDEDIRWWWNLNDIERRMMLKADEKTYGATYFAEKDSCGEDVEENAIEKAKTKVRKTHPIYGIFSEDVTDDDRPLPLELKERINVYIERRSLSDQKNFLDEVRKSSSFNAFVRKELREGRL